MPKISSPYQQHRCVIGNHTNRQQSNWKSQKYQDDYIQHLAQTPGRHINNLHRQNMAQAVIQLISLLSSVGNGRIDSQVVGYPLINALSCSNKRSGSGIYYLNTTNQILTSNIKKNFNGYPVKQLSQKLDNVSGSKIASTNSMLIEENKTDLLTSMLRTVMNIYHETDQFIFQSDPLRFPTAEALSVTQNSDASKHKIKPTILNDKNGSVIDLVQHNDTITQTVSNGDLFKDYRDTLVHYYSDYHAKYPTLATLAETTLKNKIAGHSNLQIDPSKASMMAFSVISHHGDDKIYFPPAWKNRTLTEWLFTNVEAELDQMHIAAGMYGIYNTTGEPKQEYYAADQLKIKPIEFFQLLREIDFSHYAKEKLAEFFKHKDEHIKKYFIDFVNHLYSSDLDDEAAKDVLTGIGVFKESKIQVCAFDIDGYLAFNAFLFRNKNNRVTLYLPESNFKFVSFYDDAAMRSWMKGICAQKEQRDMIASHFSMTNRQDDNSYYRIDSWLKLIHEDEVNHIIATKFINVSASSFFEYLFNQTRNNAFSDLDYLINLEDSVRDDNWAQMVDASRFINNITPSFLSLEKRLKCVAEVANCYDEKNNKLQHNAADSITKVTLSKLLNFANKKGYDFINTVIQGMDRATSEKSEPKLEESVLKPGNFLQTARKHLTEFYEDYNSKYPDLYRLARSILKEKIQARFHLSIDPNEVRFMHFDNVVYADGEKLHYSPARENKTLTEWLFTNFDAETQDNLQDMDSMCAIYDRSVWEKEVFKSSDELKIKPTDFIQLVYDIDFYNYAKNKLTAFFKDKDTHIKKYFIDLVNHLDISDIGDEAGKDVLAGVGIGKTRNVRTFLFDIDGYFASTAFIFRNEDGRVTLYFPGSDVKVMSFRGDFEMREWVTNACSTKEHRDMIAAHFTIKNRQDGIFYYGVDAWLKSINQNNDYYDKIAIKRKEIEPAHFFEFLFTQIQEKTISDLDHLIKSDAEIRRDMWENMIDASNIIPNPISPFLSLGIHLEHALEADTYEEKQQEWNKIASDTVNIVVMVSLSKVMNFVNVNGYKFIDLVSEDIANWDTKKFIFISNMDNPIEVVDNEADSSLSLNWLFDEQVQTNADLHDPPLNGFLSIRDIPAYENIDEMNRLVTNNISNMFKNHPFDIFYGFEENSEIPMYIRIARSISKLHISEVKKQLNAAYNKLNNIIYKDSVKELLSLVVGHDKLVLAQTESRLKIMLKRAVDFFNESEAKDFSNFGIVSTKQVIVSEEQLSYRSLIDDKNILKSLPQGFTVVGDPLRRVFIVLDANPLIGQSGYNILGEDTLTLYQTMIHEISHRASGSLDYFYTYVKSTSSLRENVFELFKYFRATIDQGVLAQSQDFKLFVKRWHRHYNIPETHPDTVLNMIEIDPMTRANIIIENADSFVLFVMELSKMDVSNRAKRYNEAISNELINYYLGLIFKASRYHYAKKSC